ncbi:MAG TPA: ROK family protein [bacterium]|nr:ROK family protein [bacterium]HPR87942.1 ROK family protein [bacterium]
MEQHEYIGIDIGGTKSAVLRMEAGGHLVQREQFATAVGAGGWEETLARIKTIVAGFLTQRPARAIGISCGGPLDSKRGVILAPPNLPGWDHVPVVDILHETFGLPVFLENDANAGAVAEWRFGAGKGCRNMIFLTFGTGLGAGLILDGRLFTGTNDYGGEAGHIRLEADGPIGYHKRGSFEGFCSGTGLAQMMAIELLCLAEEAGREAMLARYKAPGEVTGRDVVEWALAGDLLALKVVETSGCYLGKGLALLIDLLNPELILIGSMGVRLGELLLAPARRIIAAEALPGAAAVCHIVPAALGEKIGDFAALCVALKAEERM